MPDTLLKSLVQQKPLFDLSEGWEKDVFKESIFAALFRNLKIFSVNDRHDS